MKKLIFKSENHISYIDNPSPVEIPLLSSKVITPNVSLGRVVDIEYNYVREEITVYLQEFKEN